MTKPDDDEQNVAEFDDEDRIVQIIQRLCQKQQDIDTENDIDVLYEIAMAQVFPSSSVFDALKDAIFSSTQDDVIIKFAKLFCCMDNPFPANIHLVALVDMMLFESVEVRSDALLALHRYVSTSTSEIVEYLIESTPLIENIASIVRQLDRDNHSSDEEASVLSLLLDLSKNPMYSRKICHRHNKILGAIVDIVAATPPKNTGTNTIGSRRAHFHAIECLLHFIHSDEDGKNFEDLSERLVPWMLDFLNTSTTSDKKFKEQLLSAISKLVNIRIHVLL